MALQRVQEPCMASLSSLVAVGVRVFCKFFCSWSSCITELVHIWHKTLCPVLFCLHGFLTGGAFGQRLQSTKEIRDMALLYNHKQACSFADICHSKSTAWLIFYVLPLQSGERLLISITWTPLEDGKVRELITFVINNVVKHQAVLVGTAEHPLKKKVRPKPFIFPYLQSKVPFSVCLFITCNSISVETLISKSRL